MDNCEICYDMLKDIVKWEESFYFQPQKGLLLSEPKPFPLADHTLLGTRFLARELYWKRD